MKYLVTVEFGLNDVMSKLIPNLYDLKGKWRVSGRLLKEMLSLLSSCNFENRDYEGISVLPKWAFGQVTVRRKNFFAM